MNIDIIEKNGLTVALVTSCMINSTSDALDMIGNSSYREATHLIIHQKMLHPDFFDLKSGLAGDILQRFSVYGMALAIIGDFSAYTSKSLRDFIRESNKSGHILFVAGPEEAIERWSPKS